MKTPIPHVALMFVFLFGPLIALAQGTRLLRQPSINANHIAFIYGADVWLSDRSGNNVRRITSTAAVESDPQLSPDGKWLAFSSNRSGTASVYVISIEDGSLKRLTWHPAGSYPKAWTHDSKSVLYTSSRETVPVSFGRLWVVPVEGGPSRMVSHQWGNDGAYSPDGKLLVVDRMDRWDVEWRNYRGGQNTPLLILNPADQSEKLMPASPTVDIQPVWLGENIYFLSDRDWTMNVWRFTSSSGELKQITSLEGSDIKALDGFGNDLIYERDGLLHLLNLSTNQTTTLSITVQGDFPWAETKWEDVSKSVQSASISPTGKRMLMESRGEIFTAPVENGDARNITQTSQAADHAPLWSPRGSEIAWFSDNEGKGYQLLLAGQDGLSKPRSISIGESKMAWTPTWSPDGKYIAFTDDKVRVRIVDVNAGTIKTVDIGGINIERDDLGLTWSPDSKWLAYAKTGSNNFKRIVTWSLATGETTTLTNPFANSFAPAWDRDSKHLYFLASTDLALGSGWANTSALTSAPAYSVYVMNLRKEDASPFVPKSDEENVTEEKKTDQGKDSGAKEVDKKKDAKKEDKKEPAKTPDAVRIDSDGIERRTMALPVPPANYQVLLSGPAGTVFLAEQKKGEKGLIVQKFTLEEGKGKEFVKQASQLSISQDGKKLLASMNGSWKVMDTEKPTGGEGTSVNIGLKMRLNRTEEWKQIFEEAWHYERDFFYDPSMHGRNWNDVHQRYAPLVPYIKHRSDLTYVLDQVNGELSVGHSFVFGGDYPEVDKQTVGLLGADLVADNKRWKVARIYTTESWNPELSSPLDRPGMKIQEGNYLVGINGRELTDADDPYEFLDGTVDVQTTVHINSVPSFAGSWKEVVKPISSENNLRQRAWVEDNRRMVDKLSNGKLAYVWVPNTGGSGFVSFNRYFFAQQDKQGVVIDERFNGGGLLDDYMVDLMNRKLRAAITNEVPNGNPYRLPAGILGPKVLLINELAGSGGDFFPWVFRQQKTGPLIGARTWGGLVKSSVHYLMVDGGGLTAPDNAVFDPINRKWIAENEGVAPDIAVRQDAVSLSKGGDPQLEKAVAEALKLLEAQGGEVKIVPPAYPSPAVKKNN
ncbi:MAG: PDZ domain-containing protein [Chryseolinea sp.]